MRNTRWFPVVFVPLGLLIAVGPRTIFPVCPVGEMAMVCQGTAQATLWTGIAIAVLGAALVLLRGRLMGLAFTAAEAVGGLLTILYPTVLIGVCKSTEMTCRSLTLPALVILGGATILASAGHAALLLRTGRAAGVRP